MARQRFHSLASSRRPLAPAVDRCLPVVLFFAFTAIWHCCATCRLMRIPSRRCFLSEKVWPGRACTRICWEQTRSLVAIREQSSPETQTPCAEQAWPEGQPFGHVGLRQPADNRTARRRSAVSGFMVFVRRPSQSTGRILNNSSCPGISQGPSIGHIVRGACDIGPRCGPSIEWLP